ncbi:MAK10-like protein [Tanacetum coccineum]
MTNKIDTLLKAINDRMTGALLSDTVKNLKLNVNSTSSVLSTRSYLMEDPQSSSHPLNSINAIKRCSKETNNSQKDQLQTVMEIGTPKPKEPEKALEDEIKDLHLNLLVLEVIAHPPIYNVILDKYVESLELGKNRFAFIQGEMPKKIKDTRLFTLPCRSGDSKPFDTLADLGSYVNLIPLYLFKKLKIGLLEETDHVFRLADGTKSYPVGIVKNVEVHIGKLKLLDDFYVIDMDKDPATSLLEINRDSELNPFKDVLVFRRMVEFLGIIPINLKGNMWESKELIENRIDWNKPPKGGDEAWHPKIRLIDPYGDEFTKTF